jgi:uncharacterized protein
MTARALGLVLFALAAPPAPTRWVTDDAQAMAPAARVALDQRLREYEQTTGHQVVVYIARSTGGEPIEDWAARTFAEWKVGRTGLDDGVALFVFTDDHTARIEVGYGLEDVLTDVASSRILRRELIPKMQAHDVDGAVTGTAEAIVAALGGAGGAPAPIPHLRVAAIVVAVVLFIALAIWQPQLAWLLLMLLTGRRRNGGGGGGGGFSGGGGRSGGAGASGRW